VLWCKHRGPQGEKIGLREGIGDKLAEGPPRFAAQLGHPQLSMTVKGQAIAAYDPRGIKGMGLGYATSNRGACHLRAYTPASELRLIQGKTDPLAWEGKGLLTKIFQDLHAFSDNSLDLCKFSAFAMGAGSDSLPARFLNEPSTFGGSKGQVCELPQMLEEYYAARGWQDGVVGDAKLRELDIEYVPASA
jgi:aldehyde:ferredoxin oxidoreductase